MNWKEFFKPDWKKIVLVILLVLILPIPVQPVCESPPGKIIVEKCPGLVFVNFYGYELIKEMPWYLANNPGNFEGNIVKIMPIIVISYLLACGIVFAYNKLKR